MTTTTQVAVEGSLVQVEVLGGPDHGDPPVLTYRAHGELHVGDMVRVPAPDWVERATHRDVLPGFVLGSPENEIAVPDPSTLRDTMPLCGPESHAESFTNGRVVAVAALLREQSAAFSKASRDLSVVADMLEKTEG